MELGVTIVAGCTFATTGLKLLNLDSCDLIRSACADPGITLTTYVDDPSVDDEGTENPITGRLPRVVRFFARLLGRGCQLSIELPKTYFLASSRRLAEPCCRGGEGRASASPHGSIPRGRQSRGPTAQGPVGARIQL